jgi:hypothetical protein
MIKKLFPLIAVVPLLPCLMVSCAGEAETEAAFPFPGAPAKILLQKEIGNPEELPPDVFFDYLAHLSPGPVIPGIFQGAVPQGMAYIPSADTMVISNYMDDGAPSVLTMVSMGNGGMTGYLRLQDENGSPYTGHVGGLAVTEKHLWIASDRNLFMLPLNKVTKTAGTGPGGSDLLLPPPFHTEVTGAFATAVPGVLLVGEFWSSDGRYPTAKSHHYTSPNGTRSHALMAGFYLDKKSGEIPEANRKDRVVYPDFFITLPDRVQGAVWIDELLILSRSYGRKNLSTLSVYFSPLDFEKERDLKGAEHGAEDFFTLENGRRVPVLHLDTRYLRSHITAPPMTEGITGYGTQAALLFESGSNKYRSTARLPRDRIDLLDRELFFGSFADMSN